MSAEEETRGTRQDVAPPDAAGWRRALRRFHLTGQRPDTPVVEGDGLRPAVLEPACRASGPSPYPLTLNAGEEIALDGDALARIYLAHLVRHREPARRQFADRVKDLERELDEWLQLDRVHSGATDDAEGLSATLGQGGAFLDLDRLSGHLPGRKAQAPPSVERRERIERVLENLREFRSRGGEQPWAVLFHVPETCRELDGLTGCRVVAHDDPLEAARSAFLDQVRDLLPTVRAAHLARLLLDGRYEPELHDVLLERLDWKAFRADELQVLPQIVVLESARRVHGPELGSLSGVLRSDFPIHILLEERFGELEPGEMHAALSGNHVGVGVLALAHRESFVLQSSLGAPAHLVPALGRLIEARGPAVAVVTVPDPREKVEAWEQLVCALNGRNAPGFAYDPERGDSMAERFDLGGDPQPERIWPEFPERFTFAHGVALASAYQDHVLPVPQEAWSDDQVEIADYLDASLDQRRRALPFVRLQGSDGESVRGVITRELAFAALGRARAWRVIQELGGTDNEYANRAAARARQDAEAEAERTIVEIEQRHADAIAAAGERAVNEAMHRLAASLLGSEMPSAAVPSAAPEAPSAPPPAAPPALAAESALPVLDDEDDADFDEAYINSPLCTTCNECTNLNPRMFVYDENRQAVIKDITAGTFDELVRAAEKCPARCIHPGAPRADDDTVTEDLIARARTFR